MCKYREDIIKFKEDLKSVPKELQTEEFTYKTIGTKIEQFGLEKTLNKLKDKYSKVIKSVDFTSVKNAIKITYWKDESSSVDWDAVR
jgi:uncharacterized protein YqgV (UPF0045/DUF77 family)